MLTRLYLIPLVILLSAASSIALPDAGGSATTRSDPARVAAQGQAPPAAPAPAPDAAPAGITGVLYDLDKHFSYQGRLTFSGSPVNGTCDLQFGLFDQQSGGTQLGITQTLSAVPVADGLFTVNLNKSEQFGPAPFNGELRMLATTVRCPAGSGTYTPLSPRQDLAAEPNAQYAMTAGFAAESQLSHEADFAHDAGSLGNAPANTYQKHVINTCPPGHRLRVLNAGGVTICEQAPLPIDTTLPPVIVKSTLDSVGSVGRFSSVAIGADGLGLISYFDDTNGDLKVAHCVDAACTGTTATTTLDSADVVGWNTSVAIGADGLGLISYWQATNQDLKVAHCNNTACTSAITTTLDSAGTVGYNGSVAIGVDGLGLIAYGYSTGPGDGDLKVAHCNDAACTSATTSTLDGAGILGGLMSVAIGADGLGLISYADFANEDLKVAHCNTAACTGATITTLDSTGSVGWYASTAIGADGLGLISYYDGTNSDLKVAHCSNANCTGATITTLDSAGQVGYFTSVTTGADGLGLISYHDGTNHDLKVAHCNNANCTGAVTTSVDTGIFVSSTDIAIGADGLGLISYDASAPFNDLRVVHCNNAACTGSPMATLDSVGEVGRYASTAIGADGLGLISYLDTTNADLKVAHCNDATCSSALTMTLDSTGAGMYTSVAIGADGLGLVSYRDLVNFDLKVAHCNDTACTGATTATLDSAGDVGSYTSVAIGADGLGLISYTDATNHGLKVAHCSNAACTSATTATIDNVIGIDTDIAIGADGLGLISYREAKDVDLKVAHCNNTACTSATTTILDSGDAGVYTSVAIGADGLGLISYFYGGSDLKVAHCNNAACTGATTAILDSAGIVGSFTSVAVGADGLGLISYQGGLPNVDLKVAHCKDAACTGATTATVESAGDVGLYTSVAIGTDGLGLISYYDDTSGDLKVYHCSTVTCRPWFIGR